MKAIGWVYTDLCQLSPHTRPRALLSIRTSVLFVPVCADREESISRWADIYIEIGKYVRTKTLILVIIYLQTGLNYSRLFLQVNLQPLGAEYMISRAFHSISYMWYLRNKLFLTL